MTDVWARIRRWVVGGVAADEAAAVPDVVARATGDDVLPALIAALGSPSPQVARSAASALRKLGPEALVAVPALARLVGTPIPAGATDVQHDYARSDAAYALGDLLAEVARLRETARRTAPAPDGPPPSTLELLLLAARDADAGVRAGAWAALRSYLDDPRVRQAALAALDDPDATVRRHVVATLTPREH